MLLMVLSNALHRSKYLNKSAFWFPYRYWLDPCENSHLRLWWVDTLIDRVMFSEGTVFADQTHDVAKRLSDAIKVNLDY